MGQQEEGQDEERVKQGEVEGEVEKLRDNRTSWVVWRWGDKCMHGLEPSGVVIRDPTRNTKDSVQVCSMMHVEHVDVRRVTFAIVHDGYQDVVIVVK